MPVRGMHRRQARDQDCRACNQCPVLGSVARLWRVAVNVLLFLFHTAVWLFVVAIWGNDTNKALLIVLVAIHSDDGAGHVFSLERRSRHPSEVQTSC